ncbi:hypothetical protein PTTG_27557 [Puccinia triticina 1-1 BBBD Race 1]|uniref:Uncharacterized protein n=1 Tax=Puccinia triticina (isolate 1-1 / race 1 (BBBD)) TaxID=630390 RepID=A0A180GJ90_PUCT1|nr:hypothetical protein PTTG_27557 [Puccinia triticina 1-1 BBBD Race 1]
MTRGNPGSTNNQPDKTQEPKIAERTRLGRIPSSNSQGEGPSSHADVKGKGPDFLDDIPKETTFQPRLTQRVIGSSSNDWRRTEPAPHTITAPQTRPPAPTSPTKQTDITSLIAEMQYKHNREENRARCEAKEIRSQRRCELDEEAKISAIVNAAINKLDPDNLLKPDGSNICHWEDALRLTAFERFHDQHFFNPAENTIVDPYYEALARGIIQSSAHTNLSYNLINFKSLADVYDHLVSKFQIINRAKQLHT